MPNFAEQSEMLGQDEIIRAPPPESLARVVFRATVVFLATLAAAYVLWLLVDLLLLLFACALVSLILLTLANALRRRTGIPYGVSLTLVVIGLVALMSGAVAFFGATMQSEFAELATRLPAAWAD